MDSSPLSAETTPSRGRNACRWKSPLSWCHNFYSTPRSKMRRGAGGENHRVLKRSRHRNVSKRGSGRGNTRRKEIQLLGSTKNAAFVRRQTKCGRTRSSLFVIFNIFPFTMRPTFSCFLWFCHKINSRASGKEQAAVTSVCVPRAVRCCFALFRYSSWESIRESGTFIFKLTLSQGLSVEMIKL